MEENNVVQVMAGEGIPADSVGTAVDGTTASKSARRRKKKKAAAAAAAAEDDAMDELGGQLTDMALKQQQIEDKHAQYAELQAQLDMLSSRTANTPRGHTMLYDRKKKLCDSMEGLLDEITAISRASPGCGQVNGLRVLDERYADAVLAGHGDSARLKADLSKLQEDSALRRQRADELAARLRKRRLAEKAANETAEQRAQAAAALMSSVQIR